ncbi:MAG: lipoate--protein ligase family protein [Chlamydiota bacterium]
MTLHLLHLKDCPIFEQLQMEEALLCSDDRNFCIINEGSSPAIVMGISGKPELLIHKETLDANPIPVIKRFSGGGTVIVDENTLFVTFVFAKSSHSFAAYPEPIMRWTEEIYKDVFALPEFALRENDYVIGERKCGGNAQYIKKQRWLHHTSFLFNFDPHRMDYLLHPPKTPNYRAGRKHSDFLCTLSEHFPTKEHFITALKNTLAQRFILAAATPADVPFLTSSRCILVHKKSLSKGPKDGRI